MKTDQEILNQFGAILTLDCFDPTYANMESLRKKESPPEIFKRFSSLFKKVNDEDFHVLKDYFKENLGGILFNFLRIFEEHEQFKIIYEENGKQVNLVEISEMLKAEPIIENGWIERFSKELKADKE